MKPNPGEVLLLENLRFHPEEEANDAEFSKQLASLCDLYVNDAFGTAHRAHASTVGMVAFVPQAAAGLLMDKELTYLTKVTQNPDRPTPTWSSRRSSARSESNASIIRLSITTPVPEPSPMLVGTSKAATSQIALFLSAIQNTSLCVNSMM